MKRISDRERRSIARQFETQIRGTFGHVAVTCYSVFAVQASLWVTEVFWTLMAFNSLFESPVFADFAQQILAREKELGLFEGVAEIVFPGEGNSTNAALGGQG